VNRYDPAAIYVALREQGIGGSWTIEARGDRIHVALVAELAPADKSPVVRAAAEALEGAGYVVSRSRTRVTVWVGRKPE